MGILAQPVQNYEGESEVSQSCPTLCNPMDCSLLGSSIHGTFQARILEWVAISFSNRSTIKSRLKETIMSCLLFLTVDLEPIIHSEVSQKENSKRDIDARNRILDSV